MFAFFVFKSSLKGMQMTRMSKFVMIAIAAVLFSSISALADPLQYQVTDLGSIGGASLAYGINNSGSVVGYTNTNQAFLYSNGFMQVIASAAQGLAINNNNQVVGRLGTHAFIYSNNSVH